MKSIKEQRAAIDSPIELIEAIKAEVGSGVMMAQDVIAKTLQLSDYPKLLDWAERARECLSDLGWALFSDTYLNNIHKTNVDELLEELPE